MAATIEETSRPSNQEYRTGLEAQPGFKPRYDPSQEKIRDATSDIDTLLSGKANLNKQEHAVSTGIAQTMASDHILAMNEEIQFINGQMTDQTSRDIAIKRLQASIAATSGVTAGLSGDAAQAYDALYIPNARKMATGAIIKWKGEQQSIDKNLLLANYTKFIDGEYMQMPPETSQALQGLWRARLNAVDPTLGAKADNTATDAVVNKIVMEAVQDPTLNAAEVAAKFVGRNIANMVKTDAQGIVTYGNNSPANNAKIAKALSIIQINGKNYMRIQGDQAKAQRSKDMNDAESKVLTIAKNVDSTTKEGAAAIKDAIAMYAPWLSDQGVNVAESVATNYVMSKETANQNPNVWNGGTTEPREGQDDGRGGKYSSAYGKYQMVRETAQGVWDQAVKAGEITGTMVHGKQTEAEQDIMYKYFRRGQASLMRKNGIEPTPDNVYTMHQLGGARGMRFMMNTLTANDYEVMNDQLPKGKKFDYPELQEEDVRRVWSDTYRTFERGSTTGTYTKAMSKNAVKLQAELAKQSAKDRDAENKQNETDSAKSRQDIRKSQEDIQAVLDEKARTTKNIEDINAAKAHRRNIEEEAEQYGEDAVLSNEYIAKQNLEDLKAIDSSQKKALENIRTQSKKIAEEKSIPVSEAYQTLYDQTFGEGAKLVSKDARSENSFFINNQKAIEKEQMVHTVPELIKMQVDGGLTPTAMRKIAAYTEKLTPYQKAQFDTSSERASITKYRNSPKYNLDKEKEKPVNSRPYNLTTEQEVELRNYRDKIVTNTYAAAQGGNSEANKKINEFFGQDPATSLTAAQKQQSALAIIADHMTDINSMAQAMKNMPEFWNNKEAIGAARDGMTDKQNVTFATMTAIIRSMPEGTNFDSMLTSEISRVATKTLYNEVQKDMNGDDIDYHDSPQYEKAMDQIMSDVGLMPSEKTDTVLAMRTLVAAGHGSAIPSYLRGNIGKYQDGAGSLNGKFQTSGMQDVLMKAQGSQDALAELVVTSIAKESGIGYNEIKRDYNQKMLDGKFTIGRDESGQTVVTFPDVGDKYTTISPKFVIDLSTLEVSRFTEVDDGLNPMEALIPGATIYQGIKDIGNFFAPEPPVRVRNK